LVEGDVKGTSNCVFSTVLVSSQEDSEALSGPRWVGFSKNTHNLGIREPFRDFAAIAKTTSKLGTRDIEGTDTSGDLVLRAVLVGIWKIGHHLKGDDFDSKLILVFLNSVLSVIWTIKLLALAVLAWSSVVTANNEVGSAKILADNSMPDGLAWPTHSHSKGEKTQDGHSVGVAGEKSFVNANSGEVVDISRLCETDDWVDENICLTSTRGTNRQLAMSSVHWVSSLECDNLGPAELVKVKAELCRCVFPMLVLVWIIVKGNPTSQSNIVVVLEAVDGVNLSTHIVFAGSVVEIFHRWVVFVSSKNLLGLLRPATC